MKIFRLLRFVVLFLPACLSAQSLPPDSIRAQLERLEQNREAPGYLDDKIGALGTLFQSIVHSDPKEAMKITDRLAECLREKGDSVKYYEALYRHKAIASEAMGDYTGNLYYLEAYAEALNRIGKGDGYAYVDIGNVYFRFGLLELAKDSYGQALEIFEKENNALGQGTVRNNHAQIFMQQERYDSALQELRAVHHLRLHVLKDEVTAGDSKYLIGICFRKMRRYDSAKVYMHQVLELLNGEALRVHTDKVALTEEYSGAYNQMAGLFIAEKNWDSAAHYLRKGSELYARMGYDRRLLNTYSNWAHLYLGKNKPDSARAYIRRIEEKAGSAQSPDLRMSLYTLYAEYCKATGDMENHYRYRMLIHQLNDSMNRASLDESVLMTASTVKQLKDKARIETQDAELLRKNALVEQQEKEKLFLFAISGLFLLVIAGGIYFYLQIRKKNRLIGVYNRELEAANATKEKFLSVISHDLRNPFNTLIGMSSILVNNVRERKMDQVASNAEAISESSRKAYVLLDNLMQWVSLQKEKISVRREALSAAALVDEVLNLLRNQALAQSVSITKDIRTSTIIADKNLMQVVLRNLLSNAIRHIPVGGAVRIIIEKDAEDIRLVVEDNGEGLGEETLRTLFDKKDHAGIARKGGGLGLVLVREFVEQMGGTIGAENIPGSGARFTIVLRDAAVQDGEASSGSKTETSELKLDAQDKKNLAALARALEQYEIFDTTELRNLINAHSAVSATEKEWIERMSQAVYRANAEQFRQLIELAKHE